MKRNKKIALAIFALAFCISVATMPQTLTSWRVLITGVAGGLVIASALNGAREDR